MVPHEVAAFAAVAAVAGVAAVAAAWRRNVAVADVGPLGVVGLA